MEKSSYEKASQILDNTPKWILDLIKEASNPLLKLIKNDTEQLTKTNTKEP